MARANRRAPKRPLADPRRAPYVRAALDRKAREAERRACAGTDPVKHARTLQRLSDCLALLEDDR